MSKIHGKGIFIVKPIRKGGVVSFLRGKIRRLEIKNAKDSLSHMVWIGIGKNKWIDPSYPYKYLNHSCNPSAGIIGKKKVVAMRNLKPGDEVTVDYSITECDYLWRMHCRCGEKNCRKVIKSVNFLPKSVFKKYEKFMPNYFKNLYVKNHKN